jgi:hypothetical protein
MLRRGRTFPDSAFYPKYQYFASYGNTMPGYSQDSWSDAISNVFSMVYAYSEI